MTDRMDIDEAAPITAGAGTSAGEASAPVPPSSSSAKQKESKRFPGSNKKKFEVRKWTAVAFWSWDMVIENCAICRNHIMESCIDCQTSGQHEKDCPAAWGACNHGFHMHCIKKWLKNRNACPLDNSEWKYRKVGN